jgi:hypothetical protein
MNKINRINKKLTKIKRYLLLLAIVLSVCTNQVYAASDPISVVNNLSDFIFTLTRGIGSIILTFSVIQIGMSFKSHDPSQRANGIMSFGGGLIITFSKEILNRIAG